MSIDCAGEYDVAKEETRDFNYNWSLPFKSKENLTPLNKTWWYQTRSELDAYPFLAELDTYFGSGYVVEIFPSWNNKEFLHILKEKQWIDRHTKAIIIEFTLFNAATNYFNSMTIVLEFPPGGGCIPFHSITTFRLFRQEGSYEFITIVCEVLFLLLMILFTICEARLLYRTGWSYFKEFWNLVEVSNVILTVPAIVFICLSRNSWQEACVSITHKETWKIYQLSVCWLLGLLLHICYRTYLLLCHTQVHKVTTFQPQNILALTYLKRRIPCLCLEFALES